MQFSTVVGDARLLHQEFSLPPSLPPSLSFCLCLCLCLCVSLCGCVGGFCLYDSVSDSISVCLSLSVSLQGGVGWCGQSGSVQFSLVRFDERLLDQEITLPPSA